MAVPKRRQSRSRTRKRRSQWKLSVPGIHPCPQCHEPKRPHHVCGHCGYYDGRHVITVTSEAEDA